LEHPEKGEEARKLYADAQEMLQRIVKENWLRAAAVYGIFEAESKNESVYLRDEKGQKHVMEFLRNQQVDKEENLCLADFIAPESSKIQDHMGLFAVTAGLGIESKLQEFESKHDDYSSIMLKLLADRLAEALAEWLHYRIRKDFWGYAPDEVYNQKAFLREEYRGIRPAAGYPACPEHSEKEKIFDLLQVQDKIKLSLTESYAMVPTAAVSGYYFAHPKARYFNVNQITKEQQSDYCKRKNMNLQELKRIISPYIQE
jgi:5-methyltetrahydrofolate--homocysteine methyltransferase